MKSQAFCAAPAATTTALLSCHKELRDWRKKYCSDSCVPEKPPKPPKPPKPQRRPPNERPADAPSGVGAIGQPENGEPDKPNSKGGGQTKRSDELLAAIFGDMTLGMTEA